METFEYDVTDYFDFLDENDINVENLTEDELEKIFCDYIKEHGGNPELAIPNTYEFTPHIPLYKEYGFELGQEL